MTNSNMSFTYSYKDINCSVDIESPFNASVEELASILIAKNNIPKHFEKGKWQL